jgi:hypothetical protein
MVSSLEHLILPSPEPDDAESVKSRLELAKSELSRGHAREALQHLRGAAERADATGSDLRAVAIARAAADLATEIGASQRPAEMQAVGSAVTAPSTGRGAVDGALQHLLDSGRAVKVQVKRSVRDEGLYVVRRVGGTPALGAREAVMVLLDADDEFFALPEGTSLPNGSVSATSEESAKRPAGRG